MAVLEQVTDQITEAADRFFDAAESANERAHGATKNLVTRAQDGDLPFSDRLPDVKLSEVNLPLIDKLPEPIEAVDAYFGFWAKGIKSNRALSEKLMNRISDTDVIEVPSTKAPAKATAPKATAKKTTAKKTPTKK